MYRQIKKYGITLTRVTHNKIELLRNWRNDPKISQYMEYRDYITPEMQERWFEKINNDKNYFFIIEFDKKEIGLGNIKDIDYQKKCGEGGIYIYDDQYLNSDVSFRAALCGNDWFFEQLKMDYQIIHILKTNKRAIQYNTVLGFKLQACQENVENQLYHLTKENYYKKREFIRRLLN